MIYCVEDDTSIRELMLYALRASGFEAEGFCDSVGLFEALRYGQPRLILLDIMLPGMDGIEILKQLRRDNATAQIPVIMASAKGTEYDKVMGLDLGGRLPGQALRYDGNGLPDPGGAAPQRRCQCRKDPASGQSDHGPHVPHRLL